MKIVFLGNGPFAAPILRRLVDAGRTVVEVVARPDRPQGKQLAIVKGPVAELADRLGLPLRQPEDANVAAFVEAIRALSADLLVVADFGQILSADLLSATRFGGVNAHGSLLPKYRGAAPIAWALYHGEPETGVSILQMTTGLDAGAVILQRGFPVAPNITAGEIEPILADLAADLVLEAVTQIETGTTRPIPQEKALVTRAPKLKKEDGNIDWRRSALQIHNQVRAMQPWPIASTLWQRAGKPADRLQILATDSAPAADGMKVEGVAPGTILVAEKNRLWVQTGAGPIAILRLRKAGKPDMSVDAFLRGNPLSPGDRFG